MKKSIAFTRVLAITGTVIVWLPVIAPILFSLGLIISKHIVRFDYLMPAELFPAALIGSGLLIWAALRAHSRLRLIAWGIGIAICLLSGGQMLAEVTGLASGKIEPAGWWWALVLTSLILYSVAIIAIGIGGVLLMRDLFK